MKIKYVYDFPRPSVTATIVLLVKSSWNSNADRVILGRRGRKDGAYSGFLCVPGGFLDAKVDEKDIFATVGDVFYTIKNWFLSKFIEPEHGMLGAEEQAEINKLIKPGETIEQTAIREIFEETGLVVTEDQLELAHVHSNPDTDPRAHVVNVCYFVMLDNNAITEAKAGDDLEELLVESVYDVHNHTLAFNHNEIFRKVFEVAERKYPGTDEDE